MTTTVRYTIYIIMAVLLGMTAHIWNPLTKPVCMVLVAENTGNGFVGPGVGPDKAALLMSQGWKGDPTDKREALYNPAC